MNKFEIGDRVISVKNIFQIPEGLIGYVVEVYAENRYMVSSGGQPALFNEDELELLSAGRLNIPSNTPSEYVEKYQSIINKLNGVEPEHTGGSVNALDRQVSGNHYKDCKIQPIEYIQANGLSYLEGNVIKYTTRHSKKNGKADIEKAIHYLELILEMEYKES